MTKKRGIPEHLKAHIWKPGQSGNPSGIHTNKEVIKIRKFSADSLREALSTFLSTPMEEMEGMLSNPKTPIFQQWVLAVAEKGIRKGDPTALDIVLNRVVGKPREFHDVTIAPKVIPQGSSEMIAQAIRLTSRELAKLEAKSDLTEHESRSLSSLTRTLIELGTEQSRLRETGGFATLSDQELLEKSKEAEKLLLNKGKPPSERPD